MRAIGSEVSVGVSLGMPYYPRQFRGIGSAIVAQIAAAGVAQQRLSLDMADIGFRVEGIDSVSPVSINQSGLMAMGEKSMTGRMDQLMEIAGCRKK